MRMSRGRREWLCRLQEPASAVLEKGRYLTAARRRGSWMRGRFLALPPNTCACICRSAAQSPSCGPAMRPSLAGSRISIRSGVTSLIRPMSCSRCRLRDSVSVVPSSSDPRSRRDGRIGMERTRSCVPNGACAAIHYANRSGDDRPRMARWTRCCSPCWGSSIRRRWDAHAPGSLSGASLNTALGVMPSATSVAASRQKGTWPPTGLQTKAPRCSTCSRCALPCPPFRSAAYPPRAGASSDGASASLAFGPQFWPPLPPAPSSVSCPVSVSAPDA